MNPSDIIDPPRAVFVRDQQFQAGVKPANPLKYAAHRIVSQNNGLWDAIRKAFVSPKKIDCVGHDAL